MNYVSRKMAGKTPYEPICGEYGIRLDANESPFSPDEKIINKFCEEITKISLDRYPDPKSTALREAFAKKYSLDPENVVAGNGSDELISVIMTSLLDKGEKLVVAYPDFSMYAFYAELSENPVAVFDKGDSFSLDALSDFVKTEKARAVIFSNPCNPTSEGVCREEVVRFIENTPALCIIDEAYMDFWNESILDLADKYENLIVLKTLSKAYGAAGLRIGFAIGHPSLINALNVARSPYNVNTLSATLARIILEEAEDRSAYLASQAEKLAENLKSLLPDAEIYDTKTNFVYLKHPLAKEIYQSLLTRGIAIRYFKPSALRITSSTDGELDILYAEIKDILKTLNYSPRKEEQI